MAGLSRAITEKFPYADFYSKREKPSIPGTIKVLGNKKKGERYVCAMFAQKFPGKPDSGDTAKQREKWFEKCLSKISALKGLKSVAFPYRIGCGLAKGEWRTYFRLIQEWADTVPNIQVKIISQKSYSLEEEMTFLSNDELAKKIKEKGHVCVTNEDGEDGIMWCKVYEGECYDLESVKEKDEEESNSDREDINSTTTDHEKCVIQKIKVLSPSQKVRLFDHLFSDIRSDVILSSSKVIDEISSNKLPYEGFEIWAWNHIRSMNIPFFNMEYFLEKYNHDEASEDIIHFVKKHETECGRRKISEQLELMEKNYEISEEEEVPDEDDIEETWENTTLLEYTKNSIPEGWEEFFEEIIENEGLEDISEFLKNEAKRYNILPPLGEVFTSLEVCPLREIRVLIVGQDPYHTPGVACGIAFAHNDTTGKPQPSLRNIYKCMEKDGFSVDVEDEDFVHGDLFRWCEQGVLLMNTALTVREKDAGSHANKSKTQQGPWEYFTRQLFMHINEKCKHIVVMMWGVKAQVYKPLFDDEKHHLICSAHPASSVYNPSNTEFYDHKPFSRANKALKKWGKEEIDWNL